MSAYSTVGRQFHDEVLTILAGQKIMWDHLFWQHQQIVMTLEPKPLS